MFTTKPTHTQMFMVKSSSTLDLNNISTSRYTNLSNLPIEYFEFTKCKHANYV